ncbi:MAG: type II toxin-antitoxin system HicA family toxin [Candidatus Uhrbacteria bacterium]
MLRPISWRELVRRLRVLGFSGPFWGTKHPFMVRGNLKLHIPRDHGSDIGAPLLAEILRQAGISRNDWNRVV